MHHWDGEGAGHRRDRLDDGTPQTMFEGGTLMLNTSGSHDYAVEESVIETPHIQIETVAACNETVCHTRRCHVGPGNPRYLTVTQDHTSSSTAQKKEVQGTAPKTRGNVNLWIDMTPRWLKVFSCASASRMALPESEHKGKHHKNKGALSSPF
jgi:hypothetical protein